MINVIWSVVYLPTEQTYHMACVSHGMLGQGDVGQTFRIALEKRYVCCVTQTKRSFYSENKINVVHTQHTSYLKR